MPPVNSPISGQSRRPNTQKFSWLLDDNDESGIFGEVIFSYRVFILVFTCLQLFENISLDPAKVVLVVLVQTDQSGFDADHLQIAASCNTLQYFLIICNTL